MGVYILTLVRSFRRNIRTDILLVVDINNVAEEKQMAKVIDNVCVYMNRREFIPEKYWDRYHHLHIPCIGAMVQILDKVSWRSGSRDIEAYICDDGGRVFLIEVKGVSLEEEKGVQIKIEKILKAGEQWVKVLDVQGLLKEEELPAAYIKEYDAVWLDLNPSKRVLSHSVFAKSTRCILGEGCSYSLTEFRKAIKDIRKAGKLLSRIKAEQAKRNANWHGEAVIKI